MISNDDSGKDRESVLGVEAGVIAVGVNPSQLNLISRLANITQITHEDGILGSWQSSSRNLAWRLLDGDTLVVLVQSVLLVDLEWT